MHQLSSKQGIWFLVSVLFLGAYAAVLYFFSQADGFARMGTPEAAKDRLLTGQMIFLFLGSVGVVVAVGNVLASLIRILTGRSGLWFLIVGLLSLLGVAGIGAGTFNAVVDFLSVSYVSTKGTITSSSTHEEETTRPATGRTANALRPANRTGKVLYFDVEYDYQVNGVGYHGNRYTTAIASVTDEEASMLLSRYPEGKAVEVLYDPKNPSTAVLKNGVSAHSLPAILVPLILGVILLLVAWGLWMLPGVKKATRG